MPLNINCGLLGHVDSGKTSLSRQLSQISSTAAFDKSPASQERGITLDLGFSGAMNPPSDSLNASSDDGAFVFTFVDCPGHQSLIKTVIGGSLIIGLYQKIFYCNFRQDFRHEIHTNFRHDDFGG